MPIPLCAAVALLLLLGGVLAKHSPHQSVCDDLSQEFNKGSGFNFTVQTQGQQYDDASHNPWNLFNDDFSPTCVIFPRDAKEVETALSMINSAGSKYAIQGGGHSAGVGWNNINDGVLISFANMTRISYQKSTQTVTLEPGAHWGDAYEQLARDGVSVVGGRVGDIGMGLILGGGLSFLSYEHGFVADQLVEVDVVLPGRGLVTANAHNSYSDLFRALKGGGNRFGVVTRYEVNAIHTGTSEDKHWFGGVMEYTDPESVKAAIVATSHYIDKVNDPKAILLTVTQIGNAVGSLTGVTAVFMYYNGTQLPSHIFGEFQAIPAAAQNFGTASFLDISVILGDHSERGNGQTYQSSALTPCEGHSCGDSYLKAYNTLADFTKNFVNDLDYGALALTPILQNQIDVGRARGGNAINPPDGPYASVLFAQQWAKNVTHLSAHHDAGMELLIKQNPRSHGKPLFMNECKSTQNVYESYGDYSFLQKVHAKYDPKKSIVKHQLGPIGL